MGHCVPVGLIVFGPLSAAIGIPAALWLAFGLLVASSVAMLAVPDIRRVSWAAA